DERGRLQQGLVGARVEPRDSAAELLDLELAPAEIVRVHVGDLELAPRRGLEPPRDLDDLVVVEIEPGHGVRRARLDGLFLEPDRAAIGPELDDAVALGIAYPVCEDGRARMTVGGALEVLGKSMTVEHVVAESQRDAIGAHEAPADDERLGQPLGTRLDRVLDGEAQMPPVAEQPPESLL